MLVFGIKNLDDILNLVFKFSLDIFLEDIAFMEGVSTEIVKRAGLLTQGFFKFLYLDRGFLRAEGVFYAVEHVGGVVDKKRKFI